MMKAKTGRKRGEETRPRESGRMHGGQRGRFYFKENGGEGSLDVAQRERGAEARVEAWIPRFPLSPGPDTH